jgi:hypothetical protein
MPTQQTALEALYAARLALTSAQLRLARLQLARISAQKANRT